MPPIVILTHEKDIGIELRDEGRAGFKDRDSCRIKRADWVGEGGVVYVCVCVCVCSGTWCSFNNPKTLMSTDGMRISMVEEVPFIRFILFLSVYLPPPPLSLSLSLSLYLPIYLYLSHLSLFLSLSL